MRLVFVPSGECCRLPLASPRREENGEESRPGKKSGVQRSSLLCSGMQFLMLGFLFGISVETLFTYSARHGYIRFHASSMAAGSTTSFEPSAGQVMANGTSSADPHPSFLEKLRGMFFYEVSYLFMDVLFLIYAVLLVRSIRNDQRPHDNKNNHNNNTSTELWWSCHNPTFRLALNAAHWTVGMILGLAVTVCLFLGDVQILLPTRIGQIFNCIILGVTFCLACYGLARALEHACCYYYYNGDDGDYDHDDEEGNANEEKESYPHRGQGLLLEHAAQDLAPTMLV